MIRSYKKYSLDEILYIIEEFKSKGFREVAEQIHRSPRGLRAKFSSQPLEDGHTSLRGIKQYTSTEELYKAFGEKFIDKEEVRSRIENFKSRLRGILNE